MNIRIEPNLIENKKRGNPKTNKFLDRCIMRKRWQKWQRREWLKEYTVPVMSGKIRAVTCPFEPVTSVEWQGQ
jgi:hypothetical protein